MQHIRLCWVFHARPNNNRSAILDAFRHRPIYPRGLALNSNLVPLKSRHTVTIDANLAVNEVDEIAQKI